MNDSLTGKPVKKEKNDRGPCPNRQLSLPFCLDDCQTPAAGYRNGTSLNNDGSNGNYWSSSPNESNTNNAYNLNFHSSNFNLNNNNRYYGQSVRPVTEQAPPVATSFSKISKEQLLLDLYRAYKDARRHKRQKNYQTLFEMRLEENLVDLRDELYTRTYKPRPSSCFIIHDPKMREVFAADFRDRIVHHLFYNYTHHLFERTFIHDSYSCITGRGTHFGIKRLKHHIQSVSIGYSKPCYVMKVDIKGYFMSINRDILLHLCRKTLSHYHKEMTDPAFVDYLLETIVNIDPTDGCKIIGDKNEWSLLPKGKSLFTAPKNCGLPIGNLSSQLFSNVYMNHFDQFVKRVLHCQHYGRYVDDAYFVAREKKQLRDYLPLLQQFLQTELGLTLNMRKTYISDARFGVEFLGAFIKPFRTYCAAKPLKRIRRNLHSLPHGNPHLLQAKVNSILGVLSHYNCYRMRRGLLGQIAKLQQTGRFDKSLLKFVPYL